MQFFLEGKNDWLDSQVGFGRTNGLLGRWFVDESGPVPFEGMRWKAFGGDGRPGRCLTG